MAICTNTPPACVCLQPFTTTLQQVTILHFSVRCPVGLLFHPGSLDDHAVGCIFPSSWVNSTACAHTAHGKSYCSHWFGADGGKSVCVSPETKSCAVWEGRFCETSWASLVDNRLKLLSVLSRKLCQILGYIYFSCVVTILPFKDSVTDLLTPRQPKYSPL